MTIIECRGLDGSNPLGFLAAVGTLRAASGAIDRRATLRWVHQTLWAPQFTLKASGRDEFVERIHAWLASRAGDFVFRDPDAGKPFKNLNFSPSVFHTFAGPGEAAERLEVLAAVGTDATVDEAIRDTDFRTQSGAGHQHYLESIAMLAELTTKEDLERALFDPWAYEDEPPYLRLDPIDDRRYALRWRNPKKQTRGFEIRTVRGANRLAVEGLRLHPVIPSGGDGETTGFWREGRAIFWTWPIWAHAADIETVRSLLSLDLVRQAAGQNATSDERSSLRAMGIVDLFSSRRLTVNRMRNFTPARGV